MKSVPGIQGGVVPSPPAVVEPRESPSEAPAVSGNPPPSTSSRESTRIPPEDLAAAVTRLEEQLRQLPGGEREVHLLFEPENQMYSVEIRDKESGELLQSFPPEKLLNQDRRPADLLGTVIDRRS